MRLYTTERTIAGHGKGQPSDDREEEFTLIERPEMVLITVVLLGTLVPSTRRIQETLLHA